MCMIISKPKGVKLNYEHLLNAADHNKDGFGVVVKQEGEKTLSLYRTKDFNQFVNYLKTVDNLHLLIHMRAASAGDISHTNIQPFDIGDGYFCHNGTIFGLVEDELISDSKILAGHLSKLPKGISRDTLLELALGHDRAAIMSNDGNVTMFGKWQEVDGIFYSSSYWESLKETKIEYYATVAVYGTLKKGHGNHHLLEGSEFIGRGRTVEKYPMTDSIGFPYTYEEQGEGHRIVVELYNVTAEVMESLDDLEGVAHGHYYSNFVEVELDSGEVVIAEMYFANHIRNSDETLTDEW